MATNRSVAFLTIGQAPRRDMSDPLAELLAPGTGVRHVGLLDGLNAEEIGSAFGSYEHSREVLVTRLADGSTVRLDGDAVAKGLQSTVAELERDAVDVVALLCTGDFPALTTRTWVLRPDRILVSAVLGLVGAAQVGVLVPLPDQVEVAQDKWSSLSTRPLIDVGSPFDGSRSAVVEAGKRLVERGAAVLVLDCMAYAAPHRDALRAAGVGVPILVANLVFASVAGPLLD